MRHAALFGVVLIPLLMGGAACQFGASWRSYTNLPEFEDACLELTADCPYLSSDQNLYLIDPAIAYLFPNVAGTLPQGQRLKITSISPGSRGSGMIKIVATVVGGAKNGEKINISELFDNAVTADGRRKEYSLRSSLKRCAMER